MEGRYYIFLDEIQHVRSFEKVLASFRATLNCSIFVTGSNSKLLSGKMATLLVGRCVEFRIMPFSFKEAYDYNVMIGRNITPDELMFDYINWGGLPLRFSFTRENDIKTYLEQTYNGIIEKDIVTERSKINKEKFVKVAAYASPKYVLSLDRFDYSRDGIMHINIVDFLLGKKEICLT